MSSEYDVPDDTGRASVVTDWKNSKPQPWCRNSKPSDDPDFQMTKAKVFLMVFAMRHVAQGTSIDAYYNIDLNAVASELKCVY